jgi:hypothetical protein
MEVNMKIQCALIVLVLLVPAFAAGRAEDSVLPAGANKTLIEENLLIGLSSDNKGLQRSSALMLGYIRSERAVIPLMSVLKECDNSSLKIAAAWSLCNIGDPRGTFAVKREVEYNECYKTRLACAWYYENMVKSGTFVFRESGENVLAEMVK